MLKLFSAQAISRAPAALSGFVIWNLFVSELVVDFNPRCALRLLTCSILFDCDPTVALSGGSAPAASCQVSMRIDSNEKRAAAEVESFAHRVGNLRVRVAVSSMESTNASSVSKSPSIIQKRPTYFANTS